MNNSSVFWINKKGNHPLPNKAFIDTNVILDIYLNRRHKNDWINFIGEATLKGTDLIYTLHSLREIRNVLNFQIHDHNAQKLNIKNKGKTQAWKVLENNPNYNFGKDVAKETENVKALLDNAGFKFESIKNDSEIFELENLYSQRFDLGPGDTAIAASMEQLNINSIFTNDAGFFKTDDFNVYSPTHKAFNISKNRSNKLKKFKSIKV